MGHKFALYTDARIVSQRFEHLGHPPGTIVSILEQWPGGKAYEVQLSGDWNDRSLNFESFTVEEEDLEPVEARPAKNLATKV